MTEPLKLDDLARALWAVYAEPENGDVWGLSEEWKENHRIHIRAVLTTIKEAGWKIVPVEADSTMLDEVEDHVVGCCNLSKADATEIWRAMQSAAPKIEGE